MWPQKLQGRGKVGMGEEVRTGGGQGIEVFVPPIAINFGYILTSCGKKIKYDIVLRYITHICFGENRHQIHLYILRLHALLNEDLKGYSHGINVPGTETQGMSQFYRTTE